MLLKRSHLVCILACCGFINATNPNLPHGEASSSNTARFKWKVTTLKSPNPGQTNQEQQQSYLGHYTESSDAYHKRIIDQNLNQLRGYSIHSRHGNKANVERIEAMLAQMYHDKVLNSAEYSVNRNNEMQKFKAHKIVKNGGAVKIIDSIHHHESLDPISVIGDALSNNIPYMGFVLPQNAGKNINLMTIMHPPPKQPPMQAGQVPLSRSKSNSNVMPQFTTKDFPKSEIPPEDQSYKGKTPAAETQPHKYHWRVTTPMPPGEGPLHRSETIHQYLERLWKENNGKLHGVDYPQAIDVSLMTPEWEERYRKLGYTEEGIQIAKHNHEQKRLAFDFIRKGGAVKFPNAVHHPQEMHPWEALEGKDFFKVAHMHVERKNEHDRPARRLQLYRWMPSTEDFHDESNGKKRRYD